MDAFQALFVREYYLYREAIARKAEDLPRVHQWIQCKCRSRGCPTKISMKVVNGKLLPQEHELVHTHLRSNAAVADFACEFARPVINRRFFSFKQLRQVITHKLTLGSNFDRKRVRILSCTAANSAETAVKEYAIVVSTVAFPEVKEKGP